MIIDVIIPAFNEEMALPKVIADIPSNLVREIIVVDNGSTDNTIEVAKKANASVIIAKQKGYGSACLKGLEYVSQKEIKPNILVFLDGDYSDYPEQMTQLVEPIKKNKADLVIGSRTIGKKAKGSMTIPQIIGNKLATTLLKWFYNIEFTDLGPFRAIRYESLLALEMEDQNFGWTVEMQLKAAKLGLRSVEVAVDYRKRIGKSKISGTVKGAVSAGFIIIKTIFKYR